MISYQQLCGTLYKFVLLVSSCILCLVLFISRSWGFLCGLVCVDLVLNVKLGIRQESNDSSAEARADVHLPGIDREHAELCWRCCTYTAV